MTHKYLITLNNSIENQEHTQRFRNTTLYFRHYIEHLFIGENKRNRRNGFDHVPRVSLS